jgi:23S rRNA pseudouridine1911/1915/1917 synthase
MDMIGYIQEKLYILDTWLRRLLFPKSRIQQEIQVDFHFRKQRLDSYLAFLYRSRHITKGQVRDLIRQKKITVNYRRIPPEYAVIKNDLIQICHNPVLDILTIEKHAIPLQILYEDNYLLIVNKPAGLVTHPNFDLAIPSLVSALHYHNKIEVRDNLFTPGVVHRLDYNTTGAILIGKTEAMRRQLSDLFRLRQVKKKYHAIVQHEMQEPSGRIELYLGKFGYQKVKIQVKPHKAGWYSLSYYKVLKKTKDYSYVQIRTITGRTHQIRVHMSHLGHPLVGDIKYGGEMLDGVNRYFLHAHFLSFIHPVSHKRIKVYAPFPADFAALRTKLFGDTIAEDQDDASTDEIPIPNLPHPPSDASGRVELNAPINPPEGSEPPSETAEAVPNNEMPKSCQ